MKSRLKVVPAFAVLAASLILGVTVASAVPPLTTVEDASEVTYTTAKVKGTVNPQGLVTTYRFQVVTQEQFEAEGFNSAFGEGEEVEGSREGPGAEAVEGKLQNLQPGTTYHLRLFAENEDGSSKSVAASTFETQAVSAPDAILLAPVVGAESAELKGEVDPGGSDPAFDASYFFEVSTDGGNSWSGFEGSEGGVSAEGGKQAVTATLAGLEPNTTYELRLRATNNANNSLEDTDGGQSFSTGALAPTVETLGTLDFTATEVTFNGRINPHKAQTTYWFEWGTEPGNYTASIPATKDGDAGAANQQVLVAETISGLDPGTTVYYRLLAENGTGGEVAGEEREATTREIAGPPAPCPNQAIREEQSATFLPECRAWEQVSPNDKNGVDVQNFMKVGKDGNAVAFQANGAFAGVVDPNAGVAYVSRRGPDGRWRTNSLNPRFTPTASVSVLYPIGSWSFDEDFRTMAFVTYAPFDAGDTDFKALGPFAFPSFDVYRVGEDGNSQWLSRNEGEPPSNEPVDAKLAGISGDGTAVFIETSESLVPGVPTSPPSCRVTEVVYYCNLYRWQAGHLEAVGYDENGNLLLASKLGTGLTTGPISAAGSGGDLPDSFAVSRDGSAYVYAGLPSSGEEQQLYLHRSDGSIVRISSSQRSGSEGSPAGAKTSLVATMDDLGTIFFRTGDQLTDDAPVGGGDYRYDVASGHLTYSNPDDRVVRLDGVSGFARATADGSYAYFVTDAQRAVPLTSNAPLHFSNLYVRHDTTFRYIGSLDGADNEQGASAVNISSIPTPEFTTTAMSDDGTRFVFQTRHANVTGAPPDLSQVYLYDATADALSCLSCPPLGVAAGAATFYRERDDIAGPLPRAMSSDGSRIVFTSDAALVPQDTNGVGDVYEYLDGELHLISSGTSPYRSFFVGMSESGDDLFFETREPLAASDTDGGQYDVYDAHVGGGFADDPALASPPCSGDACQPPTPTIGAPVPGSATQASRGNSNGRHRSTKHQKKKRKHRKRAGKHRAHAERGASR